MLIARAPMRISFGGGGTDLEPYYANYSGLVISTVINKYCYAIITTDESDGLQVISADYRSLFRHSPYDDLLWDGDLALPKAIPHHFGIRRGINLFVASEVPPGTGLGSSSAAAVTLVHAISTLLEQPMTKQQVAELASYIEITKMGMPIGKQDQYASAFGGFNTLTFTSEGISVEPLDLAPAVRDTLERRLLLFFTGSSCESTSILKHSGSPPKSKTSLYYRPCTISSKWQSMCRHAWRVATWMSSRDFTIIPGRRNAGLPQVSQQASSMSVIAWRCTMGQQLALLSRAGVGCGNQGTRGARLKVHGLPFRSSRGNGRAQCSQF